MAKTVKSAIVSGLCSPIPDCIQSITFVPLTCKKFVPRISKKTSAVIDLIGRLRGSLLASLILICLISCASLSACPNPSTISTAMPIIKMRQPHFRLDLHALKSTTSRYDSLSNLFSIQSPTNTMIPPVAAVNDQTTSHHVNEGDGMNLKLILVYMIPMTVFLAFAIWAIFDLWRHDRKRGR